MDNISISGHSFKQITLRWTNVTVNINGVWHQHLAKLMMQHLAQQQKNTHSKNHWMELQKYFLELNKTFISNTSHVGLTISITMHSSSTALSMKVAWINASKCSLGRKLSRDWSRADVEFQLLMPKLNSCPTLNTYHLIIIQANAPSRERELLHCLCQVSCKSKFWIAERDTGHDKLTSTKSSKHTRTQACVPLHNQHTHQVHCRSVWVCPRWSPPLCAEVQGQGGCNPGDGTSGAPL